MLVFSDSVYTTEETKIRYTSSLRRSKHKRSCDTQSNAQRGTVDSLRTCVAISMPKLIGAIAIVRGWLASLTRADYIWNSGSRDDTNLARGTKTEAAHYTWHGLDLLTQVGVLRLFGALGDVANDS